MTRWLLAAVAAVVLLSSAGQISKFFLAHDTLMGLVRTFFVDDEANVPTWFATTMLLTGGALAGLAAAVADARRDPERRTWIFLAGLFLVLSLDEAAMLHDLTVRPLQEALELGGPFQFAWVLPGTAIVVALVVLLRPFLRRLPRDTRRGFAAAAALFFGGALGMEMVGSWYASAFGQQDAGYAALVTVEELLELLGCVVLLRTLLVHLSKETSAITLRFGPPAQ